MFAMTEDATLYRNCVRAVNSGTNLHTPRVCDAKRVARRMVDAGWEIPVTPENLEYAFSHYASRFDYARAELHDTFNTQLPLELGALLRDRWLGAPLK